MREGIQPQYRPLMAYHEAHPDGGRRGVYRLGDEPLDEGAAAVAHAEAVALARAARTAVGRLLVAEHSGDSSSLRPANERDCCILLRSRTHLRTLERALEQAGVPYRVESGKLMLATQEVRDLLACLRSIEDPSDQVALVGALRSPAYGCSDPDLLRWVEGGGRLSHEEPGAGPPGPVAAALASLADFHQRRHALAPPALVEAFIHDRLLIPAAFDGPNPREAWRRLRYVIARARAFTATGRHSLRAFLDWIDGLDRAEVREVESAASEPDEDAVRILTIHGAKGLEFPIVLLAGLGSTASGGNSAVEVLPNRDSMRPTLACRVGTLWRTADFEAAAAREKELAEAEAIRLLYVATTRARDHLVLSLYRKRDDATSPAALIQERLATYAGPCHPFDGVPEAPPTHTPRPPRPPRCEPAGDRDSLAAEQAWLAARAELIAHLAAPPAFDGFDDPPAAYSGEAEPSKW